MGVNRAQIFQQVRQRFGQLTVFRCDGNASQCFFNTAKGRFETKIVLILLPQQNRLRQLLTGASLHAEQALETKQNITVTKLSTQCLILNVGGTGALMDILGDEIIMQRAAGTALPPIAF
ncbi:hypothetical protein D3C75_844140 [compost metagenome]